MKYRLTDPSVKAQAERASQGFPLIPKGKHLMRVKEATYKVINSNDALDLDLVIVDGEPDAQMQCRDTLFFTDKALGRVLLALSALGMSDAELASVDPEDEGFRRKLVGRIAIVEIEHRKDKNGKEWANPTYAGYKVAHPGSIEEMRRMREAGAAGTASLPGGSVAGADPGEDSLPF